MLRVGVARAPIFWEDPRARRRNRTRCTEARRTRPGAQRVHSVPRSTRWPRAAHSTKETRHDAGPNAHCAGPAKKPPGPLSRTRQPLPSARQVRNDPKQSDAPAAAARWPWCAGPPIASLEEGRDGRPLHALACTRRLRRVAKPFTQFQDAQARTQGPARPGRVPVRILKGPCYSVRCGRRSCQRTQMQALPPAPSLCLSRGTLHEDAPEPGRVDMEASKPTHAALSSHNAVLLALARDGPPRRSAC